jgi:hypothetical protein
LEIPTVHLSARTLHTTHPFSFRIFQAKIVWFGDHDDMLEIVSHQGTRVPKGISPSFDPDTLTLTLTGSASQAAYSAALQRIAYRHMSCDPPKVLVGYLWLLLCE